MAENVRPYTLIRSDRKTVSIQIHEGGVIVRAPKRLAKREIDRFVADHAAWIESHLALSPVPQPLAFGDTVPLWGREVRLVPDKSRHIAPRRIPEGVLAGDTLSFPADTSSLAAAMHKWYETETRRVLLPYCHTLAESYGVADRLHAVSVTHPKKRWGSCTSAGSIRINAMLSALKPEIGAYVLTHELAHLLHMNHSAAFWAQVEAWLPGAIGLRELLRQAERRLAAQKWG